MTGAILVVAAALFATIVVVRLLATRTGCAIRSTDIRLRIPGLPPALEGIRIALLSDLHVGRLHVPFKRLEDALKAADPDLLFLGGDYAANATAHEDALRLIRRLSEGRRTYGVMGNTDHAQRIDLHALREILRQGGGDLLINEAASAEICGATVLVLGVDDPLHGSADVTATLDRAPEHADLRIALCHSPALWRQLRHLDAEITLIGHTHGGQIRFPGTEAHVTHMTYPRELAAGLFRHDSNGSEPIRLASHWQVMKSDKPLSVSTTEGPLMYVTRGVGMGVLPVRLMCPPEMVVIELERNDREDGEEDGR